MAWVKFEDMHSGGFSKEDFEVLFIEATSVEEAVEAFESNYGHNPYRISCGCCGANYSISEPELTLNEASYLDRSFDRLKLQTLEEFVDEKHVKVIKA